MHDCSDDGGGILEGSWRQGANILVAICDMRDIGEVILLALRRSAWRRSRRAGCVGMVRVENFHWWGSMVVRSLRLGR